MGLFDTLGDIAGAVTTTAGTAIGSIIAPGVGTQIGGLAGASLGNLFDNAISKIDDDKVNDAIDVASSAILGGLKKVLKSNQGFSGIDNIIELANSTPVQVVKESTGKIITKNIDKIKPELDKLLGNSQKQIIEYFTENFKMSTKAAEEILPIISSLIFRELKNRKEKIGNEGLRKMIDESDETAANDFREFHRKNKHNFDEVRNRRHHLKKNPGRRSN